LQSVPITIILLIPSKKMLWIVNFLVKSPDLECWNALRKIIFGELRLGTV